MVLRRPSAALDDGRLAFEFKALSMIPAALGGVGLDVEPCCQFVLEIKAARDLELDAAVTFDVHLDVAGYPGSPPRVHCNTPLDHLPVSVQRSQTVDPMGQVRLPLLDARAEPNGWSRSYNAAVVFYALRRLFLKAEPKHCAWRPAPPRDLRQLKGDRPCEPVAGRADGGEVSRGDSCGAAEGALELVAGHGCDQGKRHSMEDVAYMRTHIRIPERDTANAAIFAVFDGHGGRRCAEWASELLPERILWRLKDPRCGWREAIWDAFAETDAELRKRSDSHRDASGSTVLCVVFDGRGRLYVASLGDCRCVLASQHHGYVNLTTDCRADRPDEVARVVEAKGFVANRRVNGQIAVSRALGDFAFKQPPDAPPAVSWEPDISEVLLRPSDDFLVLGCDGLYDVLTSEEAVDHVRGQLFAGSPLDDAALNLVHHAIDDKDSRDNVSVVLVKIAKASNCAPTSNHRGAAAAGSSDYGADDPDRLLADLDLDHASSPVPDHRFFSDQQRSQNPNQANKPKQNVHDEADAAAGGYVAQKKKLQQQSTKAAGAYAREDRPSKSKILDDDDLMDFLLDDANFD